MLAEDLDQHFEAFDIRRIIGTLQHLVALVVGVLQDVAEGGADLVGLDEGVEVRLELRAVLADRPGEFRRDRRQRCPPAP